MGGDIIFKLDPDPDLRFLCEHRAWEWIWPWIIYHSDTDKPDVMLTKVLECQGKHPLLSIFQIFNWTRPSMRPLIFGTVRGCCTIEQTLACQAAKMVYGHFATMTISPPNKESLSYYHQWIFNIEYGINLYLVQRCLFNQNWHLENQINQLLKFARVAKCPG